MKKFFITAFVGFIALMVAFTACGDTAPEQSPDEAPNETEASASATTAEATETSAPATVGDTLTLGDFDITLDEFVADATDEVLEINEFNEEPDNAYALSTLTVTYTGDSEADPWIELTPVLVADGKQVDAYVCDAVVSDSFDEMATLESGGSITRTDCFDVDPATIDRFFVEPMLSLDDERATWNVE